MEELKKKLFILANEDITYLNGDFDAYEYSGGNYGDAWEFGMRDGMKLLARDVLSVLHGAATQ